MRPGGLEIVFSGSEGQDSRTVSFDGNAGAPVKTKILFDLFTVAAPQKIDRSGPATEHPILHLVPGPIFCETAGIGGDARTRNFVRYPRSYRHLRFCRAGVGLRGTVSATGTPFAVNLAGVQT